MSFRKIAISLFVVTFCALIVPSHSEAQSFLDKVKDRAKDAISDEEESDRGRDMAGEGAASQARTGGFSARAQRFYDVYQSRYSQYPELEGAFRQAEAYFDEFLSERLVRCDNEWYAMDDDEFGVLVDAYPDTDLYADTEEHLSKMTNEFWPYVNQVRNDQKSIYMAARGSKSALQYVEWRSGDSFSESDVLNGWELQARGQVDGRLNFEWPESYDRGEWGTVAGFGYLLEKRDGEVNIKTFNSFTTTLSRKVTEWATTAWNQTHQKIPADFSSKSDEEQCVVLNGIATSN